ncbi:MAG: hypothetical protein RQ761_03700 [Bacteroidales bacterium]|nr:hypothetical protein [Bacteroidales bacterium]
MKNGLIIISFALLMSSFYQSYGQCTQCSGTNNSGANSSAIGQGTSSIGINSFASGTYSVASGNTSTSLGMYNLSSGIQSVSIGSYIQATNSHGIAIGSGGGSGNELINSEAYSLMVGFNSIYPTLFVSNSTTFPPFNKTGKIGIGNVTDPQAKLHLKADEGENAAMLIQPYNWLAGESASLALGSLNYGITSNKDCRSSA